MVSSNGDTLAGSFDYEVPTWNQIYELLLTLSQRIQSQHFLPHIIVGISRGGLIPARILVDLLETKEFTTFQIQFYTNIEQTLQKPILKRPTTTNLIGKRVLLVDDIADSGQSLKLALTHLRKQDVTETKTVTLYLKPRSKIIPDFYGIQTSKWVVFPWDTKETLRKIIQGQQSKEALNFEVVKLQKAGLPAYLVEKFLKEMT
jgi:uncharacterized protein